jgi:hypothetical protein
MAILFYLIFDLTYLNLKIGYVNIKHKNPTKKKRTKLGICISNINEYVIKLHK